MGTSVQVTPLSGVYNENPLCYLVAIDGFNFLIDCGWNDHFDPALLEPLSRVAPTIDAVLLSHPDIIHLGALPYAMKKLGLSAPIYSTEPVFRLGLLTMYDYYLSLKQVSEFDWFTLDDIDMAFQSITRLTYSQNFHLSGKGEGIVIAPHVAGHLLGGTLWKITKDGEDVIYAVDFNHRKERHLNGTVLESFVRPAVLITDAFNALNNQPYRRQRDQEFLGSSFLIFPWLLYYVKLASLLHCCPHDAITRTLMMNGKVLLPVDSGGRVLELLLILEQHWTQHDLSYPIFFLTYVASSTVEYVKSFLEWMSDSIAKSFEHSRDNAFTLNASAIMFLHLAILLKLEVVLASMASLEAGFSHDIFVEWAADAKNLVLFTERGQGPVNGIVIPTNGNNHNVLQVFYQHFTPWFLRSLGDYATLARMLQADPPPKAVKVTMSQRVPLVGEELAAYEEEQNRKKEEELKASIKEEELKASHASDNKADNIMVTDTLDAQGLSDAGLHGGGYKDIVIDGFVPPSTAVAPMFPFYENSAAWDDYGEVINPDDYVMKDANMDETFTQAGGDLNGKFDEAGASLMLDMTPSKVVCTELTVQVKCSLLYMDFEGRADGRSIKSIIGHVAPLKLVLVHGSAEATEHLKQHCQKNVPHVYAPQIGETIDVTSDLCAYKLQLSEKLMSNVLFKKLGDYEIAWIDAEVGKTEKGMLSLLPLSMVAPPHKSVLVGDLKMADFKQFLASQGIQAEFSGGALRCGEFVTLRKVGDPIQKGGLAGSQQIVIEGPLTEEYYKIRDHLYSQFYLL
ncbi:Cleavage and polyadenylation specificity factor subunit 2-like protein [Drosera capensis]